MAADDAVALALQPPLHTAPLGGGGSADPAGPAGAPDPAGSPDPADPAGQPDRAGLAGSADRPAPAHPAGLADRGAPADPVTAALTGSWKVTATPPGMLTPREREIVALVCAGRSNRAIAEELFISPATAARHVANILAKLGFTSRIQIAAWAADKHFDIDGTNGEDRSRP